MFQADEAAIDFMIRPLLGGVSRDCGLAFLELHIREKFCCLDAPKELKK